MGGNSSSIYNHGVPNWRFGGKKNWEKSEETCDEPAIYLPQRKNKSNKNAKSTNKTTAFFRAVNSNGSLSIK